MNAPPGVDSDSSEEEISPISSPAATPIKPKFSFKTLFIPARSTPATPVSEATSSAPHSPANPCEDDYDLADKGGKSHLAKLKRRVRILAGGDQKPTTNKGDEVEDIQKEDEQENVVEEKDQAAVEMLTLLRQLVAQSRLDIPNSAKVSTSDPPTPVLSDPPRKDAEPASNPDIPCEAYKPPKKTISQLPLKAKPDPKASLQESSGTTSPTQNVLKRPQTGSPGLNDTYFYPEHSTPNPSKRQQPPYIRPDGSQASITPPDNRSNGQQTQQLYSAAPWQTWHTPQNGQNQPPYHPSTPHNYPPPMYPHPPALQPWHPSHGYGPAQPPALSYPSNYPQNKYDPYDPPRQGYGYQTTPHPPFVPPFQPSYTQGGATYNSYPQNAPGAASNPPWSQHPYLPPQPSSYPNQYPGYPPAPQHNSPVSRQSPWSPLDQLANPWSPINGPFLRSEGLRLRPVNQKLPEWAVGPDVSSMMGSIRCPGQPDQDPESNMGDRRGVGGGMGEIGRVEAKERSRTSGQSHRPKFPDSGFRSASSPLKDEDKDRSTVVESMSTDSTQYKSRAEGEEHALRSERVETTDPRGGKMNETAKSTRDENEVKEKPEEQMKSKGRVARELSERDLKAARREKAKPSGDRTTDPKAPDKLEVRQREAAPPSGKLKSKGSSSEEVLSAEREKAKRSAMLKAANAGRGAAGNSKGSAEGMHTGEDGGRRSSDRPERSPAQIITADKERAKRAAMLKATLSQREVGEESPSSGRKKNGQGKFQEIAERRSRERSGGRSAEQMDEPFAGMLTSKSTKSIGPPSENPSITSTASTGRRKATEPDWTKALISLAICIDLGYTQFQRHKRKADANTETNDVLIKLVVGLAKTLGEGRDIPSAFEAVFGDRLSGEVFARELKNVAAFIAHSSLFDHHGSGGKSEKDRGKTRQLIDLLLSDDRVHGMLQGLPIGGYVTPGIVGIVKNLAGKWLKDELSLKLVLRSVLAIRKELDHPTNPQQHSQQQGILDHLAVVLSKQLKHQSAAIPGSVSAKPSHDESPSRTESTTPKSAPPQLRPSPRARRETAPVEENSSDSVYSEPESPGTRESDEEADRLLAAADSGPKATPVSPERTRRERPGKEQVKAAKEILMQR